MSWRPAKDYLFTSCCCDVLNTISDDMRTGEGGGRFKSAKALKGVRTVVEDKFNYLNISWNFIVLIKLIYIEFFFRRFLN